jgi:hypothetical protein
VHLPSAPARAWHGLPAFVVALQRGPFTASHRWSYRCSSTVRKLQIALDGMPAR